MATQAPPARSFDPTGPLRVAANHFSKQLFSGSLPAHAITLQRGMAGASVFIPARWRGASGAVGHEIALNPTRFARRPLLSLFQSLVREQCHLWQHQFGRPTRPGYHNLEWSKKMGTLGFRICAEDAPGRQTGQNISLDPVGDGPFVMACARLVRSGFSIEWLDRGFEEEPAWETPERALDLEAQVRQQLLRPLSARFGRMTSCWDGEAVLRKRKVKYGCPVCNANVWGRPGLSLACSLCHCALACAG